VNSTKATTLTNFPDTSKTQVTPRAGLLVHVSDRFALRGSVYGGFRAPSLNELYRPFRVGNVLTQGNPKLGPERLLGGELGLNHALSSSFSWRATAFWDRVKDPIANVTIVPPPTPGLTTRQRQNLGRARIRGVSVEATTSPPTSCGSGQLSPLGRVTSSSRAGDRGNLLPRSSPSASLRLTIPPQC
jgi:outer membrane receptor protein involved in Fe transport